MSSSASNQPSSIAPQLTLLASLLLYPTLFLLITPSKASTTRFSQSREALSAAHTGFMTLISLYALQRHGIVPSFASLLASLSSPSPSSPRHDAPTSTGDESSRLQQAGPPTEITASPLATTRSTLANCITALETGYLIQDAIVLILDARLRSRARLVPTAGAAIARADGGRERGAAAAATWTKEINWRLLGWHHAGLAGALGVLQWYIARGKDKAVLVIVMLFLMNASSPIGALYWYLVNFRPGKKMLILLSNVGYLVTYALCRVYLVFWVLQVFGAQTGRTAIEAFRELRMSCKLGTAGIAVANSVWLGLAVRKFWRRYGISGTGERKRV